MALIGASGVTTGTGAAYIFVKPGGGWATTGTPTARLTNSTGTTGDQFGLSVSLSSDGSTAMIGAPLASNPTRTGMVYVFIKPGGGWVTTSTPTATITNAASVASDRFGNSVSLSQDSFTALIGADGVNSSTGAAYIYFAGPITATTTTLVATPQSVTAGNSIGLTATVDQTSPNNTPPTGNVQFYENGTLIDTGTLPVGGNQVSTTVTLSTVGTDQFYAVYVGDSNNITSTSSTIDVTVVSPSTPTVQLTNSNPDIMATQIETISMLDPQPFAYFGSVVIAPRLGCASLVVPADIDSIWLDIDNDEEIVELLNEPGDEMILSINADPSKTFTTSFANGYLIGSPGFNMVAWSSSTLVCPLQVNIQIQFLPPANLPLTKSTKFGKSVAGVINSMIIGAPGANSTQGAAYLFNQAGKTVTVNSTSNPCLFTFNVSQQVLPSSTLKTQSAFGTAVKAGVSGSAKTNIQVSIPGASAASVCSTNYPNGSQSNVTVSTCVHSGLMMQEVAPRLAMVEDRLQLSEFTLDPSTGMAYGATIANSPENSILAISDTGGVNIYDNTTTLNVPPVFLQQISAGSADNLFGFAISLSTDGEFILVGAPDENGGAGAAYLYEKEVEWVLVDQFVAPTPTSGDQFGFAVAIAANNKFFVIGAPGTNYDQGIAYIFLRNLDGSWSHRPTILASTDATIGEFFGAAVDICADPIVVVGAPHKEIAGFTAVGETYVFEFTFASQNVAGKYRVNVHN